MPSSFSSNFIKRYLTGLIPCMYLESRLPSDKLLIYFHQNAEDISTAYGFADEFRRGLGTNILLVEYPGYSLYQGKPSEKQIYQDAATVMEFITTILEVPLENIIIMGRSLGSGPATYLASKYKVKILVLVSAFTSIKSLVKDILGGLGSVLVKDAFINVEKIKQVRSNTLIVHGAKDQLVKMSHAEKLQGKNFF